MTDTRITGRLGAMWEAYEKVCGRGTRAGRERYWQALAGELTEADVAELERGDLSDPQLVGALDAAYEHLDPAGRDNVMCRRRPSTLVSDAELEARVAQCEATLKEKPADYEARSTRLEALSMLATRRRRDAILAEAAAHRAATRERQGLAPMASSPGWERLLDALSEAAELHRCEGAPWRAGALGEDEGRLTIESSGGDAFTRGLEALVHIASGHLCQGCGAPGRECLPGRELHKKTLCTRCAHEVDAQAAREPVGIPPA